MRRRPIRSVATGDGMAAALRAGASIADAEFIQFHPTVLWQGLDAEGQQLLVSEAVRGRRCRVVRPERSSASWWAFIRWRIWRREMS